MIEHLFIQGAGPERDPFELFPLPRISGKFSFDDVKEKKNTERSNKIFVVLA